MKISEVVAELLHIKDQIGDREVLITDGFRGLNYRGSYSIVIFEDIDGGSYADIGIGNNLEDETFSS